MNATNLINTIAAHTGQQTRETTPQSFTPPIGFVEWVACLAFLIFLMNQGGKLVYSLRGKPTPQELEAASTALNKTLTQIQTTQAEHARRLEQLEASNILRANLDREEHGKLYNKINACAEGIARIEGHFTSRRRNPS